MIILVVIGCLIALIGIVIGGMMVFELAGRALTRFADWFIRKF